MARAAGPERWLLAVYTGGTIGMRSERGVLVPGKGLAAVLRMLPMFHDEEHARARGLPEDTLVLPPASPDQRVFYTVLECQPLFDSSDMTITEWVQIAQIIEELGCLSRPPPLQSHYARYDGFVVIHGTDTMAFAASVLSFVLENLQKTVILTGAQVPIHALWNDGRENLLGALLLAGQYVIPEVRAFLQPPMKGVVMETFGSGNGPTKPDLLQELRAAAERGLVIVNCTHCLQGAVTSDYGAGVALSGAGTVPGFDMTSEAALAKLSYVLGLPGLSLDGRKEEADEMWDALVPSLACAAAYTGDLEALQVLVELGSDRSLEDFSGQTPLHAAARAGQAGAVTMLLQRGLDVNARDKGGLSPLLLAVGGRLASRADCEGLRAWGQAGADLRQPGYDGHSALHVAEAAGNLEAVALLQNLRGGAGGQALGPDVFCGGVNLVPDALS
ncbi:hypothetical protein MJT46_012684 [Ovis ammon polii x Ovis aries]|nr:hypothetical protein MJT46_012684 [Ovis ammon polii x Ovis aries]